MTYTRPTLVITHSSPPVTITHGPGGTKDELLAVKPYANNIGFLIVLHKRTNLPATQEPYVTHVYNAQDNAFYYGNYFTSYTNALRDFNERGCPDPTYNTAE